MLIDQLPGSGASASAGSRAGLGQNFDTFLQLLTTQLQNQDPLSPMDADQFTSQLVQFSSVEQAIRTNEKLDAMTGMLRTSESVAALDFVGTSVAIDGSTILLDAARGANIGFELARPAQEVSVRILDEDATIIRELNASGEDGNTSLVWDGKRDDGTQARSGLYRIDVIARDEQGRSVESVLEREIEVDAIEFDQSGLVLVSEGSRIPFAAVRQLSRENQTDTVQP